MGEGTEYSSAAQPPIMASHRGNRVVYSSPTRCLPMISLALLFLPTSASFKPQCRDALSVSRPSHRGSAILSALDDDNDDRNRDYKRFIIASAFAIVPYFGWDPRRPIMALPPAAHALQEKNEVLCNTGFFTNVGAWYCTDIGNIGDEGKSKALSDEANSRVDSLMSKFDFDDGEFGGGAKGRGDQASETGNSGIGDTSKAATRD